ncbi:MAG: hypothetical protein ACLUUG_13720 [Lachnospiraceae bacterium]
MNTNRMYFYGYSYERDERVEAAEKILAQDPQAKILLLTTFSDDEYIIKALKAGVKGYLLKQDYQSILPALRAVCCGQSVLGQILVEKPAFDGEGHKTI